MWQSNSFFCAMFGASKIQQSTPYFQAQWWLHHVMGMLVIIKDWGVFQDKKMELTTGKVLEENLVLSAVHQTLGEEFTVQQGNNLKHKAKSTLELRTKKTVNVPEWASYIFDLNLLENLWQDLKMVV